MCTDSDIVLHCTRLFKLLQCHSRFVCFISDHILLLDIKHGKELENNSAMQLQYIDLINSITDHMPKLSILFNFFYKY